MVYICYAEHGAIGKPQFWHFIERSNLTQCPRGIVMTADVIVEVADDHYKLNSMTLDQTYAVKGKVVKDRYWTLDREVEVIFHLEQATDGSAIPVLHHIADCNEITSEKAET